MAMRWRLNGCKVLAAYLPVLDTYFFTGANTYIGVSATGCGGELMRGVARSAFAAVARRSNFIIMAARLFFLPGW